jgi:hypothetical protein
MRVFYSMVGLPITAEEKFREATYFFNRMLATRTNVCEFPFNFSAFLSAFRSVTFYLQAQHRGDPRFEEWYRSMQETMRAHAVMKRLKALRDEALHARPVSLLITQGPDVPEEGLTIHEIAFDTDPHGNMRTFVKLEKDGPDVLIGSLAEWNLDDKDGPIILQLCDEALRELRSVLDEWRVLAASALSQRSHDS